RVHQYGLKDRPNPHSRDVQYPERQLMGISSRDKRLIEVLVLEYLE
ncbi:phage virion morphogenesis protein, partial [Enterobacter hormaechei]